MIVFLINDSVTSFVSQFARSKNAKIQITSSINIPKVQLVSNVIIILVLFNSRRPAPFLKLCQAIF